MFYRPRPAAYYVHYEAEAGKAYVDFCISYKNTSGANVGAADVFTAELLYAGKYHYTGSSIIETDSRGNFTYSLITAIAPLTTEYLHYLFEVPEEIMHSSEPMEITFTVDGNRYTYTKGGRNTGSRPPEPPKQEAPDAPAAQKQNVPRSPVFPKPGGKGKIICPVCGAEQRAGRSCCMECGVAFWEI